MLEYNEQGYVVVPGIFTRDELGELDREIARIDQDISQSKADGEHNGWIMQLGLRSEKTQRYAEDHRILGLVEDIVKLGIAIYSANLSTKQPHSNEVCHWHQDDAYYIQKSVSDTRMSVWAPLQDASMQNGCLWVVPVSHKLGLQPTKTKNQGCIELLFRAEDFELSGAIPLPIAAGAIVLFDALLWHNSKGNDTNQIRRAFIVLYQEATVPAGNGKQWKILRPAR